MRLWLDDIRPAPDGWVHARSVRAAVTHLATGQVTEISLDHDLGDHAHDGGDGIAVVDWMAEHDVWPPDGLTVHSGNPVGRDQMLATVDRYSPYPVGHGASRRPAIPAPGQTEWTLAVTPPTTVAFAGDWHANLRYATRALHHLAGRAQFVLHVGDFGYRFTDGYLDAVEQAAAKAGVVVGFVDGNHEDFDWLLAQPVDDDGVRRLRTQIWHLPRGLRWTWHGLRFLALGGAHSVDRPSRRPQVSWWPQETLSLADALGTVNNGPADVMVTHDCPDGVDIPGLEESAWMFDAAETARLTRTGRSSARWCRRSDLASCGMGTTTDATTEASPTPTGLGASCVVWTVMARRGITIWISSTCPAWQGP